jgi:hypothetical protein
MARLGGGEKGQIRDFYVREVYVREVYVRDYFVREKFVAPAKAFISS